MAEPLSFRQVRLAGARPECCLRSAGQPIAVVRSRRSWWSQFSSDQFLGEFRAQHTRPDLGKSSLAARGSVIAKRRESAVVSRTKVLNRYVLSGFEYHVPHFFRSFNAGIGWSSNPHENALVRFPVFVNDFQSVSAVALARHRDVKIAGLQLKQAWQQLCVIDIRAVRRIEIIPRARMDSYPPALFR